jgi:hypothetical protein
VTLPPDPKVNAPAPTVLPSASFASNDTVPFAVPLCGVTLIVALTLSDPCVIPVVGVSASVVLVATDDTLPQLVVRFAIFNDPNPVAMS